ncbi:hypothetical protein ACWT_3954 [Actinoplanes sp. SE50]|uniref:ATP-grasp domain-containing protein n=1 Tax=unclassified Actinoplanes TaxID=2626549 RepID=UPI00023ED446|nr:MULTISPECIES: ATP-grasp domain-containing protein [unclassified Actinoplanes]AEV84978.1 hypothetical protein ACPL_4083 [Actinoplanes sp. SE50/110]ATO83369.1 hypothetical protein ACWT_3954 [Actinoplanes sp. SE50]SLM00776.1 hypothetical protein ACSP50_4009 [Actinoplanes sp. SE50/110]
MMLLVPGDPVRPRRPDGHFAAEAAAAPAFAVVDHDALAAGGDADAAVSRVPAAADAVYRGWMLSAPHYAAMAAALCRRGVTLRTSPGDYQRAHELPGWYAVVAGHTPETVWTDADIAPACAALGGGAAVLRDYTKSMKHYWHEAAYVPDVTDVEAARRVAARFRELRDDAFTGGLVLRRFEPFRGAEVRTWWLRGSCRLVTAHPDTPDELPPDDLDPGFLAPAMRTLALPFVTADLARHADGRWRLVEIGDGQVSDRPATTPPARLIDLLATAS